MTRKRSWASDKDRGNNWFVSDYQDSDKSICKTMTIQELQALDRTPASESIITIVDEALPGMEFELHVQPKEYQLQGKGQKSRTRKPVNFSAKFGDEYFSAIPLPGQMNTKGGWYSKHYYSHAVKLLANEIIPAYKSFFGNLSGQDTGLTQEPVSVPVR